MVSAQERFHLILGVAVHGGVPRFQGKPLTVDSCAMLEDSGTSGINTMIFQPAVELSIAQIMIFLPNEMPNPQRCRQQRTNF